MNFRVIVLEICLWKVGYLLLFGSGKIELKTENDVSGLSTILNMLWTSAGKVSKMKVVYL